MILVINNSGTLKKAYSTPKIINFLKINGIKYKIISKRLDLNNIILNLKNKIIGIILSGSDLKYSEKMCTCKININLISLLEFNIPILGICFGFQTIGISYGGKISTLKKKRQFKQLININNNELFLGLSKTSKFQQYHHDYLSDCPPSFNIIAYNDIIQGIKHNSKPIYGVQFHPELSGKSGEIVLFNFVNICHSFLAKIKESNHH